MAIGAGIAGLGAGAVGGMMLENALERREYGYGGTDFLEERRGMFGNEYTEVRTDIFGDRDVTDVRTDMFGNRDVTDVRTDVFGNKEITEVRTDMFGDTEVIRENVDRFGDVTYERDDFGGGGFGW
jgi:hypothetical protein